MGSRRGLAARGERVRALLNYQRPDPSGRQMGRYINQADRGDVVDVPEPREVTIRDARSLASAPRLDSEGFECRTWPSTKVKDWTDASEVRRIYYAEMASLVRAASGASLVYVFDHTIRESGQTNLNAPSTSDAAATVARVHCDYTADGAPRRLAQLLEEQALYDESGAAVEIIAPDKDLLLNDADFAFVNVWRSIDADNPVKRKPLAVLDERTVDTSTEAFTYELRFPDRTGENYSLKFAPHHAWYYYPAMTFDECLLFKCYDRRVAEHRARFVFHTAFDDPTTPDDAPPRRSIECRTIAFFPRAAAKPNGSTAIGVGAATQKDEYTFFDMKHSNNAARIRLWLELSQASEKLASRKPVLNHHVTRQVLTYPDLQTDEYAKINPLRKVPALVRRDDQTVVFESDVILTFLEDKFGDRELFTPATPEARQRVDLMIRCHDLYVASPNCTADGFSHSQGAMYLSHGWHGPKRGMDADTRAAKLKELWHQVTWLDQYLVGRPYLAGEEPTLADLTWFPTCVFMEFMLPRVFAWPQLFDADDAHSPTPRLAKWYNHCQRADPAFATCREDILDYWREMDEKGQFDPIVEEIQSRPDLKWLYP